MNFSEKERQEILADIRNESKKDREKGRSLAKYILFIACVIAQPLFINTSLFKIILLAIIFGILIPFAILNILSEEK